MAGKVELYQIYWKESQKDNLYPFAIPYFNPVYSHLFENQPIIDLVSTSEAEKIGVCSYALRQKKGNGVPIRAEFEEKHLYQEDYDVLALGRRDGDRKMLFRMDHWHPGSLATLRMIWERLGLPALTEPKDIIYSNHFVSRTDVYKYYVNRVLKPAIDLMENDPVIKPLAYEDSDYFKLKSSPELEQRVKGAGWDYIPLHTFLCERMFSCFILPMKLNVKYLPEIV